MITAAICWHRYMEVRGGATRRRVAVTFAAMLTLQVVPRMTNFGLRPG